MTAPLAPDPGIADGDPAPLVVIGIGNLLLRDDAVGVRVVETLAHHAEANPELLPVNTRLVDGGTLGMDLLDVMRGARAVLIVDGVDLSLEPGEITVLDGEAVALSGARRPGGRNTRVGELVATARLMGWLDGPVALVGVQVDEVTFNLGLSPRVAAAVPRAVDTARRIVAALDAEAAHPRESRAQGLEAVR